MVILSVHNSYQQPGGEDEAFRQEACLLEKNGHEVVRCQAHNDELNGKGSLELLRKTIYNSDAYRRIRTVIRASRPEVMHVHNTFPLLSPAVYYAAHSEGVPVVQTLHNYRLLCPSAVLFRKESICERCVGAVLPWQGIVHGCYRNSRPATAATASMLAIHRLLRTDRQIGTYIALSEFAAEKFVRTGIARSKIVVKPNFLDPDPGPGSTRGSSCLFVGRLSAEKGVRTLLDAWTRFSPPMDLEIAGDGELASEVQAAAERTPNIRWLGRLQKPQLYDAMKNAAALIVPSTWYEPFGIVLIEAFAMSVPAIASKIGALTSMVSHLRNGLHFESGNAADLANQVRWLHEHPDAAKRMRNEARRDFELRYSGTRNYSLLMKIYKDTIARYREEPIQAPDGDTLPVRKSFDLVKLVGHRPASASIVPELGNPREPS